MRRTTICRSNAPVLAAVLLAVSAGGALAQRGPTTIQRPIEQAQRAAAQTNAATQAQQQPQDQSGTQQQGAQPAPAMGGRRVEITQGGGQSPQGVQGGAPASHTVQQGETLWALAQQYLGDPLLWPEIYRINTDVVEDPHWIYPGEELRLQAAVDTSTAEAPAAPPPGVMVDQAYAPPAAADSTPVPQAASTPSRTIFMPQPAGAPRRDVVELRDRQAYRAVREGEYYSSGFLTEEQALNSGHVIANAQTYVVGDVRTRESTMFLEDAVVDEPPGDSLQAGDLLLTFERGDPIAGYGEIIRPTGLLRVRGPWGNRYRATVVEQYDRIQAQQELIKVAPFSFNSSRRATPVSDGVETEIVAVRTPRELAAPLNVVFLGKGADDGIRPGDVFQIYKAYTDEARGGRLEQDQARALVVNVRSRSATAVIIELYHGDIRAGSPARQVRRMPS